MDSVFALFNGLKLTVKRIHIRYEDDTHNPFSIGLTIDKISLCNTNNHWDFNDSFGMHFKRMINTYVNQEFDIVRLRVYVNTKSEMVIPSSLLD
jgi:Vacuolar sorting-associated protein 13, N-terminal